MPSNEGEVYFSISGDDFDPEIFAKTIGIKPTRMKRKGRIIRKGQPIPRFDSCHYSSGKVIDEVIDIYQMSKELIEKLAPKAEAILQTITQYNLSAVLQVVLSISIDDSISTPTIGFDTKTIEFLSRVGASIDIDTYRK